LLDDPSADPDDDLRILARQLLRRRKVIERLEKRLAEQCDDTLDLVHVNRDTILRIHEEGIQRLAKLMEYMTGTLEQADVIPPIVIKDIRERGRTARKVIEAINTFHPMHGESWSGWPEGS
jgi:hypothetical protein